MSRTLRKNVTLDAGDGNYTTLKAGTSENDLSSKQRDMLRNNSKAWQGDPDDSDAKAKVAAASSTAPRTGDDSDDQEIEDEFTDMTVPELRDYAEEHQIDLGDATRKKDIKRVLRSAG